MWPTMQISASLFFSGQRRTSSCSGESLCREMMPAPWRLRRTVGGGSEKTRRSRWLPMRRRGISLGMRPLLRTTCGGKREGIGRCADGVAVDDELDAAVALAAVGGVIRSDGLRLAEAAGGDRGGRDALLGEEIAHGIGAAFGELLIEFVAAYAVGVTFDLQSEAGMREDDAGNFGEFFAGAGREGIAAA